MELAELNRLPIVDAQRALSHCCGSSAWYKKMVRARPFRSMDDLYDKAEKIWWELSADDWREAFEHHPRIGDLKNLREKFGATAGLASQEQSGAADAGERALLAFAEGNHEYEMRYGFIFIVCATGKSAAEMLALMRSRMNNPVETELRIAAGEQAKITRIRLEKLFTL